MLHADSPFISTGRKFLPRRFFAWVTALVLAIAISVLGPRSNAREVGDYYLGFGYGIAESGVTLPSASELEERSSAQHLQFGLAKSRHINFEMSYLGVEAASGDVIVSGGSANIITRGQVELDLLSAFAVAHVPIGEAVALRGKVGVSHWWAERRLSGRALSSRQGRDLALGFGLEFSLSEQWALSCAFERFNINAEKDEPQLNHWGLGLKRYF